MLIISDYISYLSLLWWRIPYVLTRLPLSARVGCRSSVHSMSFHGFSFHMGQYLKMHTMWSHSVSDPQEHIIFLLVVAHSTHEMCDLMTTRAGWASPTSTTFCWAVPTLPGRFERCVGKFNEYHCTSCGSCKRISVESPPHRSLTNNPPIISCVDTSLYMIYAIYLYNIYILHTYYIYIIIYILWHAVELYTMDPPLQADLFRHSGSQPSLAAIWSRSWCDQIILYICILVYTEIYHIILRFCGYIYIYTYLCACVFLHGKKCRVIWGNSWKPPHSTRKNR